MYEQKEVILQEQKYNKCFEQLWTSKELLHINSILNEIKYSKVEKVKKFMNVKLYGAKLSIVTEPNIKGAKNITKNLLFNKVSKFIFLKLTN